MYTNVDSSRPRDGRNNIHPAAFLPSNSTIIGLILCVRLRTKRDSEIACCQCRINNE